MSDDPTPLSFPTSLPFPITITRIHATPGSSIARGQALLTYRFTSSTSTRELARLNRGLNVTEGVRKEDVREGDMSATWESSIEGDLVRWEDGMVVGRTVERRHASRPVIWLQQACTHPVQLHGLCGICGADLTSDDYLSIPAEPQAGPSRHGGYEMSHDAMGVTVSTNVHHHYVTLEAKRLDDLTRDTLLRSRKLSLIVDLDQTIIHTTVDPTVGEWMADIEKDERPDSPDPAPPTAHGSGDNTSGPNEEGTTKPPGSPARPAKRKREPNPNAEALRDVARFQLADDPPPNESRRKGRLPERWYYTKPRPGLNNFLDTMSEYYEMHVYTMGTRTYADAICKVIDPEGKIFGDRILSRDESGNFTSKNLKRLFPTDQSMVVVIDDRQDVWGDCPNLVKVVPYDFFIGIGDINSSFLPPTPAAPSTAPPSAASSPPPLTPPSDETTSAADGLLLQTKLLDEVSEARPLARLQEELEEQDDGPPAAASDTAPTVDTGDITVGETSATSSEAQQIGHGSHETHVQTSRKPLLNDNDHELDRLSRILRQIHESFYDSFDAREHKDLTPLPLGCDVELIVPDMKSQVLQGCSFIFSGLIPRTQPPETAAIWQTAETFGAIPSMSLTSKITHCIAATLGTEKTYRANKLGVPVVWQGWFWESVNLWERQDEAAWLAMEQIKEQDEAGGNGSGLPTPGPSSPNTPTKGGLLFDTGFGAGGGEEADLDHDFGDMGDLGNGWDDEAQAELDAFLEGSSDFGSDAGTSTRSREETPGTPSKKRVRYADEEHLPLESYKDPSPHQIGSPPAKKPKPLLLRAPDEEDEIPESNKFAFKPSGRYAHASVTNPDDEDTMPPSASQGSTVSGDGSEVEEEDEFARMLREELDE